MFGNKEIKESLEEQQKEMKSLKKENKDLKSQISENNKLLLEIKKAIDSSNNKKDKSLVHLDEVVKAVKTQEQNFERITRKLDNTNSEIEKKMFDRLSSTMRDSISKLDADVSKFNSLKDEIGNITKTITSLNDHIARLNTISEKITAADFDLSKYRFSVEKYETEKLRLLRKIDNLESIMAKMKQSRNRR